MESIKDPQWYEQANCATTDPEVMFPPKGGSIKLAKAVCERCLVTNDCLISAVQEGDFRRGFRGGMTGAQRRKYAESQGV